MTPAPEEKIRFLAVEVMGFDWNGFTHMAWRLVKGVRVRWNPRTVPADRDMLVEKMREKGVRLGLVPAHKTGFYVKFLEAPLWVPSECLLYDTAADSPGDAVVDAAYAALKEKTDG